MPANFPCQRLFFSFFPNLRETPAARFQPTLGKNDPLSPERAKGRFLNWVKANRFQTTQTRVRNPQCRAEELNLGKR